MNKATEQSYWMKLLNKITEQGYWTRLLNKVTICINTFLIYLDSTQIVYSYLDAGEILHKSMTASYISTIILFYTYQISGCSVWMYKWSGKRESMFLNPIHLFRVYRWHNKPELTVTTNPSTALIYRTMVICLLPLQPMIII